MLEGVQKKVVNMVSGLRGENYEEKCRELGLESLAKRRYNQDMQQTYKIIRGKDQVNPGDIFSMRNVEGRTRAAADPFHLQLERSRLDVRKFSYTQRVVNNWNKLDHKIKSGTLAEFKTAIKKTYPTGGEPERS